MDDVQLIYSNLESDSVLEEIVREFVSEIPNRLETLTAQAESEDWESLRETAHQLKGAFGGYGFSSLMAHAGQLEAAVREQQSEDHIRGILNDLVQLCRLVR